MKRSPLLALAAVLFVISLPRAAHAWGPRPVIAVFDSLPSHAFRAASDGEGGVLMTWVHEQLGLRHVRAQRIDSTGSRVWQNSGVELAPCAITQLTPQIVSDGAGGALIVWEDHRTDPYGDLYGQHVSAAGAKLWGDCGAQLVAASGYQITPVLVEDGAGGGIVAWMSDANGGVLAGPFEAFAQRFDGAGSKLWGANGVKICDATSDAIAVTLLPRGDGSLIAASLERRLPARGVDLFGQAISSSGAREWGDNGVEISIGDNDEVDAQLTGDGAGGAWFAWRYPLGGALARIGLEHRDRDGIRLQAQPVSIAPDTAGERWVDPESRFAIGPDGAGGLVVASVMRAPIPPAGPFVDTWTLVSHRFGAFGAAMWDSAGLELSPPSSRFFAGLGLLPVSSDEIRITSTERGPFSFRGMLHSRRLGLDGLPRSASVTFADSVSADADAGIFDGGEGGVVAGWWQVVDFTARRLRAQRLDAGDGVRVTGSAQVSSVGSDRVTLALHVDGGAGLAGNVSRRTGGGPWQSRGAIFYDFAGNAAFADALPDPETDYEYRASVFTLAGEQAAASVTVRSSGLSELKLAFAGPNPSPGSIALALDLPAGSGSIDLYDLAGRRVESLPLPESLSRRAHVTLGGAGRLPAGLYIVQLRHSSGSRTLRVAILP